ncbi:hypothetical protein ACJX0J_010600 [Zea mays]
MSIVTNLDEGNIHFWHHILIFLLVCSIQQGFYCGWKRACQNFSFRVAYEILILSFVVGRSRTSRQALLGEWCVFFLLPISFVFLFSGILENKIEGVHIYRDLTDGMLLILATLLFILLLEQYNGTTKSVAVRSCIFFFQNIGFLEYILYCANYFHGQSQLSRVYLQELQIVSEADKNKITLQAMGT